MASPQARQHPSTERPNREDRAAEDRPSARRPGRPRLDEEAGEEGVRERLIQAATELAIEQGFDASGLREIAARAEVSPGMVAYYFGDRRGLYEAMFQSAFERISAQVAALLDDPERRDEDRLDELLRLHVGAITSDPWLPRLLIREVLGAGDSPMRARFRESVGGGPLPLVIRWLEEEQTRGVLRADFDPRLLALSLASLAAFPFLMLPVIGEEIGLSLDESFPDRLIRHNQKLLGHGLRARPEETR